MVDEFCLLERTDGYGRIVMTRVVVRKVLFGVIALTREGAVLDVRKKGGLLASQV